MVGLGAREAPRRVLVIRALRAALRMVLWEGCPWWTLGIRGGSCLVAAYGAR